MPSTELAATRCSDPPCTARRLGPHSRGRRRRFPRNHRAPPRSRPPRIAALVRLHLVRFIASSHQCARDAQDAEALPVRRHAASVYPARRAVNLPLRVTGSRLHAIPRNTPWGAFPRRIPDPISFQSDRVNGIAHFGRGHQTSRGAVTASAYLKAPQALGFLQGAKGPSLTSHPSQHVPKEQHPIRPLRSARGGGPAPRCEYWRAPGSAYTTASP